MISTKRCIQAAEFLMDLYESDKNPTAFLVIRHFINLDDSEEGRSLALVAQGIFDWQIRVKPLASSAKIC